MPPGMVPDLVACPDHATGDRRKAADVFAYQKKDRRGGGRRERFENGLGGAGVGAVVEGEVRHPLPRRPAANLPPEQRAIWLIRTVGPRAEGTVREMDQGSVRHGGHIKRNSRDATIL